MKTTLLLLVAVLAHLTKEDALERVAEEAMSLSNSLQQNLVADDGMKSEKDFMTVPNERELLRRQNMIRPDEINSIVQRMRKADAKAAEHTDIVLDYQAKTTPDSRKDLAQFPFFKKVNPEIIQQDTYVALMNLIDNYHPNTAVTENWSEEQYKTIDAFLDLVIQTEVFQIMWQFLSSKGLAPEDLAQFRAELKRDWFTFYDRQPGKNSSSGFEHVFAGELKNKGRIVNGHHYWLSFYHHEKQQAVNYMGYLEMGKEILPSIHYSWQQYHKKIGGFLIGTSPEFDFSLFTMCYRAKTGRSKCKFTIDGQKMTVVSYQWMHTHLIATTYPVACKD